MADVEAWQPEDWQRAKKLCLARCCLRSWSRTRTSLRSAERDENWTNGLRKVDRRASPLGLTLSWTGYVEEVAAIYFYWGKGWLSVKPRGHGLQVVKVACRRQQASTYPSSTARVENASASLIHCLATRDSRLTPIVVWSHCCLALGLGDCVSIASSEWATVASQGQRAPARG